MGEAISDDEFFEALDALMVQAFGTPYQATTEATPPSLRGLAAHRDRVALARDPEDCARVIVEFAEANDDPDAWKLVAAALDWYLSHDKTPPLRLLRGINEAFKRWRGGEPIAVVFGDRSGPLRPGVRKNGLIKNAWARTDAVMMALWVDRGLSEDAAARKVAELREHMSAAGECRGSSTSSVKRSFEKFFKN